MSIQRYKPDLLLQIEVAIGNGKATPQEDSHSDWYKRSVRSTASQLGMDERQPTYFQAYTFRVQQVGHSLEDHETND